MTLGESSSRPQFLYQLSHGSKRETKYPDGATSASKGIGIDGCVYKKSNNLINIQVQAQYNIYILYHILYNMELEDGSLWEKAVIHGKYE